MEDIIQLLTEYQKFRQTAGTSANLQVFGQWLAQPAEPATEVTTDEPEVNAAGLDAMVGYLLGGLVGYAETWTRLAFTGLPVVSLIDFGILKTVESLGDPSKTLIAQSLIGERTTCMESIKRLTQDGLLAEEPDTEDKRVKRVHLTPQGVDLIQTLNLKMQQLGTLLVGDLTEKEKQALAGLLVRLNNFHQHLYREKSRNEVREHYLP